jgi:Tol biopolymer transport system component
MRRRRWLLCAATLAALLVVPPTGAAAPRVCGERGRLAASDSRSNIEIVDAAGTSQSTVVRSSYDLVFSGWATRPSWSPDGQWLAYGFTDYTVVLSTKSEVRLISVDGARTRRVASVRAAGTVSEVAWSPDGRRLAFVLWTQNYPVEAATWTPAGDHASIFVVDRAGGGLRPVIGVHPNVVTGLTWAPDARHLAFTNGLGVASVAVVDVDARVPVALPVTPPTLNAGQPVWSPDGRHLAFTASPVRELTQTPRVWVGDHAGAHARELPLPTWEKATWSPDSRWLAAAGAANGITAIRLDGGATRQLTTDRQDRAAVWSPDGTRLAFVRPVDPNDWGTIWTVDLSTGSARPVSEPGGYQSLSWCPIP